MKRHLPALRQPDLSPRRIRTVCDLAVGHAEIVAEGYESDCPACIGLRRTARYRNRPGDEWYDIFWEHYVQPGIVTSAPTLEGQIREIAGLEATEMYVDELRHGGPEDGHVTAADLIRAYETLLGELLSDQT